MRIFLILLAGLAVISCGDSEDTSNDDNSTDPIVGTWVVESDCYTFTLIFDPDGTFTNTPSECGFITGESYLPTLGGYTNGNWVNIENENFADYPTIKEYQINSLEREITRYFEFSDDFNSFVIPDYGYVHGFTYVRQ